MPIIMNKSSGSSSVAFIPPVEAFKKPRQILRRGGGPPGNASGRSTPNSGQSTPKDKDTDGRLSSLAERERAYMDARDRIFRSSESSTAWEEPKPMDPNPIHSDAKSNSLGRSGESRRR